MVISILMVIMGLITLRGIPVSKYPEITPPMVQVTTLFNGANAVNVEQAVATPIEQQVNGVEEMLYMKSINAADGSLTLQVSFEVGTNLDNANMLTQNRVSQASAKMPNEVKAFGVTTKKSLVFPLMLVSLTSPDSTYDGLFLNNYANINIVDQLKRLKGRTRVVRFEGRLRKNRNMDCLRQGWLPAPSLAVNRNTYKNMTSAFAQRGPSAI